MKTSKITVIGLLICLCSIFYQDTYWLAAAGLERLPELARYGFPIGLIIVLIGLFTDRAYSMNDNKISSNKVDENDSNGISKTICPNCNKKHDIDYPRCPYCNHKY